MDEISDLSEQLYGVSLNFKSNSGLLYGMLVPLSVVLVTGGNCLKKPKSVSIPWATFNENYAYRKDVLASTPYLVGCVLRRKSGR